MSRQNFRILIVLSWLLAIVTVVISSATEIFLPSELKGYLDAQKNTPITASESIKFIFAIVYIIFSFVISVGLFLFKRWAKTLLLLSYAIGALLLLAFGPYVQTGLVDSLEYLGNILNGIILALVYFSPVSRMFSAK